MKYGFIKVASAVPTVEVADCRKNVLEMESLIAQAEGQGVEIIVFPELCITGYTCQDLFRQQLLLDAAEHAVMHLLDFTRQLDIISIVGLPIVAGDLLLNCALVMQKGKILGIVPKTFLPNYSEFYEKRWFAPALDLRPTPVHFAGFSVLLDAEPKLFRTSDGVLFAVELCEDVWAPTPPSNRLALAGADIIFNLSASNELIGKHAYLKSLLAQRSAALKAGYVYSSAGFGESSQDVVYGGKALIYENGEMLAESKRFTMESYILSAQIDVEHLRANRRNTTTFTTVQRSLGTNPVIPIDCEPVQTRDFVLEREVNSHPFVPSPETANEVCDEVLNIQVTALAKRLLHTRCKTVVLGVSGGLDSTLALLVCAKTFDRLKKDRSDIIGVTMPGFGTTKRTHDNALSLMKELGITSREVNIEESVMLHLKDIGHDIEQRDVTYENAQARERTQILMDIANQTGGMVIGTGDLSELALGWATYNGDHMSMYGLNASLPKTFIPSLLRYVSADMGDTVAATVGDIIDTPISPELMPADQQGNIVQKTEDLVGPYILHDFFIYYFLHHGFTPRKIFVLAKKAFSASAPKTSLYDDTTILKWMKVFCRRFFSQQFKRSCLPDGPKVGLVSLSPRGDWRMPSDAVSAMWEQEIEAMEKSL